MKKHFIVLAWVASCSAVAFGQTPDPAAGGQTAPSDPQVAALPNRIAFTKIFTYREQPVPANETASAKQLRQLVEQSSPPIKIEVLKDGETEKVVQTFANRPPLEVWKVGGAVYLRDPATPGDFIATTATVGGNKPGAIDADFGEVAWVSRKNYTGEQMLAGSKCYAYKAANQTAWIDEAKRLPVACVSPDVKIAFTYGVMPDGPLQLPDDLKKKREYIRKAGMGANP